MNRVPIQEQEIYKGNLILVNRNHPIKSKVEQATLMPVTETKPTILLERNSLIMLRELLAAVFANGEIIPVSGYRNHVEQKNIYTNSLKENGEAFTRKYVAFPNCSEHQTGLAIDLGQNSEHIDFIRPDFPYYGICQRFREKAYEYGFIERYPIHKESITGIGAEPWHFRYVGIPHSLIMKREEKTLEEYIDFLREADYKNPYIYKDSYRWIEVFYQKYEDGLKELCLTKDLSYEISGNNVDGFIIAVWKMKYER